MERKQNFSKSTRLPRNVDLDTSFKNIPEASTPAYDPEMQNEEPVPLASVVYDENFGEFLPLILSINKNEIFPPLFSNRLTNHT